MKINDKVLEQVFDSVEENQLDKKSRDIVIGQCHQIFEKLMNRLPEDASEEMQGTTLALTFLFAFQAGMGYYAEVNEEVPETPEFVLDLSGEDASGGVLVRLDQDSIAKLVRLGLRGIGTS